MIELTFRVVAMFSIALIAIGILIGIANQPQDEWDVSTRPVIIDVYQETAEKSEAQYHMASRSGTAIDMCVYAGLAAAAYLQAQDEAEYTVWKQVEERDCARAGLR